ncbi:MAG TPA: hypothetical protein VF698_11400, partial [Thermoanaerobaculia bacterium]
MKRNMLFTLFATALAMPLAAQQANVFCTPKTGEALKPVGEIKSVGGKLQGVVDTTIEKRNVTYYNANTFVCNQLTLRTYNGYQGFSVDPKDRVTPAGIASPGPTLRAAVGDSVELIFMNRIDATQFPRTSVTSKFGDCDTVTNISGAAGYPQPFDKYNFPNCFHASNTTNMHFHGTHVTPGTFGDNVLIGVIPDPAIDPKVQVAEGAELFKNWGHHSDPTAMLQKQAMTRLEAMLEEAKKANSTNLVAQLQSAVDSNKELAAAGEWPQYWPGFYPYRFTIPRWSGSLKTIPMMGQSPGLHWYHAHQHGSTSLQLLNGLSGLFVITGDYDDKILRLGGGTPEKPKIKEQVMIFSLFQEQPNQVNASNTSNTLAVNGQVVPTIRMKANEVQWWRIGNAAMRAHGIQLFLLVDEATYNGFVSKPTTLVNGQPPAIDPRLVPSLNQTARDGVQYDWRNYQRHSNLATFELAPANRVDFLVKAPPQKGTAYLVFWPPAGGPPSFKDIRANTVLKIEYDGQQGDVNTQLPTQEQYPRQPEFLTDITEKELSGRKRTVTFSMTGGIGGQPSFFIDGKQFQE